VGRGGAGRIGAIDEAVAVVVDHVAASGALVGGSRLAHAGAPALAVGGAGLGAGVAGADVLGALGAGVAGLHVARVADGGRAAGVEQTADFLAVLEAVAIVVDAVAAVAVEEALVGSGGDVAGAGAPFAGRVTGLCAGFARSHAAGSGGAGV